MNYTFTEVKSIFCIFEVFKSEIDGTATVKQHAAVLRSLNNFVCVQIYKIMLNHYN